ncbi:hypothetical protein D1164_02055 [Mariniphaga sediminis]|jgi:cell division protein FtsB|uniref:NlpC/P60 domain-containing protein n=1 Tax=Mariniphaga sediminis TaxID=1628158 RepID=A0A399DAU1_9BACT|nr:hypothetical protein [Mariniphaga sediminis]RIH67231.1 hypothetical protein D1164_02055 [Mariniphaga sediminis]
MENRDENMLGKFQAEEKKSKKRMFLFSSIPLVITIILISASYLAVNNANKQVKELRVQKQNLESTINELNQNINLKTDSLAEMKKVMELAVNYKDKRHSFNFSIDKELYSRYPSQTEMLSAMRNMIENKTTQWHLGGTTPEVGFDSPSFATYMINKYSDSQVAENDRYNLRTILPSTNEPEVGDIVFYEHGYAMFYFEYKNKPFVVGMTPIGLASLTLDFGPRRIGYGDVKY